MGSIPVEAMTDNDTRDRLAAALQVWWSSDAGMPGGDQWEADGGWLHDADIILAAIPTATDETAGAFRLALIQIEHDGEVIKRLTKALAVATHSPHDQDGEPNEGFPVCSVCGAIQTATIPAATDGGLRAADRLADGVMAALRLRLMTGGASDRYTPGAVAALVSECVEQQRARLAAQEEERP